MALPEYEALINDLVKRKEQDKAKADAMAQGEAQRRGLVNQTGTSDIETSLRGAATAPIENAYTSNIAQLLGQQAEKESTQKYNTGEREAGQGYNTSENVASRNWQAQQAEQERQFQDYLDLRNKGWTDAQIRKARSDWWKTPVGNIGGVVGGKIAGGIIDRLFGS